MSENTHNDEHTSIVYKKSTGIYTLKTPGGDMVTCSISSRLRKRLIYPSRDPSSLGYYAVVDVGAIEMVDPVAIGDEVIFTPGQGDSPTGMITEIMPRRAKLTRQAAGEKPLEQVIAANVDQVLIVTAAAQPKPRWGLVDRYLVAAEADELDAVICITKLDLVRRKAMDSLLEVVGDYRRMGYKVLLTSSVDASVAPDDLDAVRGLLKDRVSVLVGMSGVGKTTLLNAVQPELGLRVGEINVNIEKGRHTTTHLEMFPLDFGGSIIDTPGMKIFGLWKIEPEDIAYLFPDMAPHATRCKFGASCTHSHEPRCAVKAAVEAGEISQRRYESYLYLYQYIHAEY